MPRRPASPPAAQPTAAALPAADLIRAALIRAPLIGAVLAAGLALGAPAAAQSPAAAAIAPQAGPGQARTFSYAVDWGPLPLAEVTLSLEPSADGLTAAARGASLGVAAMFSRFEVEQSSAYGPEGVLHEARGRFSGRESLRRVRWDGDGAAEVLTAQEARRDPGPLTPIPAAEMADTVDPAFPVVDALNRVAQGQGCGGTWRVFDGVRRMNITLTDEGPDTLTADRDWTYAGPARRCRLSFERVGGFPPPKPDAPAERDYARLLWIAELPEGPAPVRLEVSWPLGVAVGRIDLR